MSNSKNVDTFIVELFREGTTLSRDLFIQAGRIIRPHSLKKSENEDVRDIVLVAIQQRINRCLRKFGLCLKSRNYYSEFYVTGGSLASKEVARYDRTAETLQNHATTLATGIASRQVALDLKAK